MTLDLWLERERKGMGAENRKSQAEHGEEKQNITGELAGGA